MLQKYDSMQYNCNILKFKHNSVKIQKLTEMSYFCHKLTSGKVSVKSKLFTRNLQNFKQNLTNQNLVQFSPKINIANLWEGARYALHLLITLVRRRAASWRRAASCKLVTLQRLYAKCVVS